MAKAESKKTPKASKKESKALVVKPKEEKTSLKKFEKREFSIILDHELATLIRDYWDDESKPTLQDIVELCEWGNKQHEICVGCLKKSKFPLKISNEYDLITYLVHKDVLEEGDWIVLVTVK